MINQINSNSIDGESSFTVWFSNTSGQVFDVNWEKDSDTIYSTDCNQLINQVFSIQWVIINDFF